jgi:H+-transporting ATPase
LLIVRNIAIFDTIVITLIGIYAYFHAMPWSETIPLILTSILAAIPVALPATFTMASAIGAKALTKLSVLPTRLSAVDEAGTIDVLCADKTGTLTRNLLSVSVVHPMPGFTSAQVLELAALASSDGGQDPVDSAIRLASSQKPIPNALRRTNFIPFDPEKKTSAATATDSNGAVQQIIKGAFESVNNVTTPSPDAAGVADELQKQGLRVLAVASGPKSLQIVGLIALSDQPRDDSAALVKELTTLGVRTVMITGDAAPTAEIVAKAVGLSGTTFPSGSVPTHLDPDKYSVFAGVVPEGKFDIVKAFQQEGYSVGMCGDGANDAPALRQAQIGIAVSTATDVAKSAAGVVLITPGLSGIVAAIKEGRITFQRILNYTINSVIKKLVQLLLLAIGLIMTGHAVLTPLLMVIVMITGDFLAMSLTTDNVEPSTKANTWQIGKITASSAVLALCFLAFCLTVVAFGKFRLGLGTAEIQTLAVVSIVFGSQATIYAIRGHHTLFGRRPTIWLVLTSAIDVSIISTLAACGILMAPIPVALITAVLIGAIGLCLVEEFVKLPVFARLGIP